MVTPFSISSRAGHFYDSPEHRKRSNHVSERIGQRAGLTTRQNWELLVECLGRERNPRSQIQVWKAFPRLWGVTRALCRTPITRRLLNPLDAGRYAAYDGGLVVGEGVGNSGGVFSGGADAEQCRATAAHGRRKTP